MVRFGKIENGDGVFCLVFFMPSGSVDGEREELEESLVREAIVLSSSRRPVSKDRSTSTTASLPASYIRFASRLSMAKTLSAIARYGVSVHGFDGGELFMSAVVFAATRSQAKQDPVGGTITCPGEAFGIDKCLKPQDGLMRDCLPVIGNGPGDEAKLMGRECIKKVWEVDPLTCL